MADASAAGAPMNWRKEAGERLRRLHSLLFGADAALKRGDAAAAQALALRLLGFLDSQTLSADTGPDAAFVAPIRAAASNHLAAASRARAPDSDRYKPYPAHPPAFASGSCNTAFSAANDIFTKREDLGGIYCGYCSVCANIVAQSLGFTKCGSDRALGICEIWGNFQVHCGGIQSLR